MGIIGAIASFYVKDYDVETNGFRRQLWTDDKWLAFAKNELNLVLVTSWSDLATRVVFAAGLVISLTDMKALLSYRRRTTRVGHGTLSRHQSRKAGPRWTAVPANAPSVAPLPLASSSHLPLPQLRGSRLSRRLVAAVPVLFAAWGVAVLALHLHAASLPRVKQCWLQVRPWGVQVPSCFFVEINCNRQQISGTSPQVEAVWKQFRRETVERVLVRRCPQLELPAMLQEFHALYSLKVYNSSIVEWDTDAAITANSHPRLATVFLIRVTLPNGSLPLGLTASVVPSTLREVTVCASNLRQLPGNLDQVWPPGLTLLF